MSGHPGFCLFGGLQLESKLAKVGIHGQQCPHTSLSTPSNVSQLSWDEIDERLLPDTPDKPLPLQAAF